MYDESSLESNKETKKQDETGPLYESYVAALWQRRGWHVEKTGKANTPDFGADLLIYDPYNPNGPPVYAVQCKFRSSPLGIEVVREVYPAKDYYKARIAVILSNQPLTASARELAERLGILYYTVGLDSWRESLPFGEPVPKEDEKEKEQNEWRKVPGSPDLRKTPFGAPSPSGCLLVVIAVAILFASAMFLLF